jgi:predicted transglutaminase-like cysteine proteinase
MVRSAIGALCAAASLALFSAPTRAGAAAMFGPTVFGTEVLPARSTPYDARWSRVQSQKLGAGEHIVAVARRLDGLRRLRFVNAAVNRAVTYRRDSGKGNGDYWASAAQTFARGSGDCEDYAIAKMQVLRASGISDADLFLVIGNDLATRSAHALLVVRTEGKFWVLDNLQDPIRADSQYRDFRPVISLSKSGSWLHGYKVGAAG